MFRNVTLFSGLSPHADFLPREYTSQGWDLRPCYGQGLVHNSVQNKSTELIVLRRRHNKASTSYERFFSYLFLYPCLHFSCFIALYATPRRLTPEEEHIDRSAYSKDSALAVSSTLCNDSQRWALPRLFYRRETNVKLILRYACKMEVTVRFQRSFS